MPSSLRATVAAVPVRVRGKRKAGPEEKWNYGKRRDPKLCQRRPSTSTYGRKAGLTPTPGHVSSQTSTSRPRKRRRREALHELSPLEALPPEVLQTIFAYSANIMLPLTSTQLASKLCNSMHLRYHLSDCLLNPVLGNAAASTTELDLASATRLLNSRFMDLAFFKAWLRSRSPVTASTSETPSDLDEADWTEIWSACQPSPGLLPPQKLLSTPFTPDKTEFLSILSQTIDDLSSLNPSYGELAFEGLTAAVQSGNVEMASILFRMGIAPTTDTLRAAVIDAACDEKLVEMLLRSSHRHGTANEVDLLDPMIWSWAETAREKGNAKGHWLMNLLREAQGEAKARPLNV